MPYGVQKQMTVTIEKGVAKGVLKAPPSKSMAHRNLICGALGRESVISGVDYSKDILATLNCLKMLGARVDIKDDTVTIGSLDLKNVKPAVLDCIESGSTLRFLLPLCMLCSKEMTFVGSGRLLQRPMTVYEQLCEEKGISFYKDDSCIKVKGKLNGGVFTVDGGVSSQFISGLLFALPKAEEDSVIKITGDLQSQSYLNLTLAALSDFGIKLDYSDIRNIKIKGNQNYSSKKMTVEGDYSNSAFFDALNFLGGSVRIDGLKENSLQGDRVYKELFFKLKDEKAVISLADCPDLGPILFALAAVNKGALFTDTARLRLKESDRIGCMEKELKKFGIKMDINENSVRVYGGIMPPKERLFGHNDHRIVMALSVLLTLTGGTIEGAEAVEKSLPQFFSYIELLGIKVKTIET